MWNLYQKAKLYRMRPSDLIGLGTFCKEITGLPGTDEYTAYCLDNAVEYLGGVITSKLYELDGNNKAKYQLKDLLSDHKMTSSKMADISALFGMEAITVETLWSDPAYIAQVEAGLVKKPPGWDEWREQAV